MKATVLFRLKATTPGSVRFEEVDEKGNVLKGDNEGALIATQYIRKQKLGQLLGRTINQETAPKTIRIDLTAE